jgi:hypothetical protein
MVKIFKLNNEMNCCKVNEKLSSYGKGKKNEGELNGKNIYGFGIRID